MLADGKGGKKKKKRGLLASAKQFNLVGMRI